MKLHVDVGADILSLVDFPYPVVPIVRCHHENWDGTGYPRGVNGDGHSDRRAHPVGRRLLRRADVRSAVSPRDDRRGGARRSCASAAARCTTRTWSTRSSQVYRDIAVASTTRRDASRGDAADHAVAARAAGAGRPRRPMPSASPSEQPARVRQPGARRVGRRQPGRRAGAGVAACSATSCPAPPARGSYPTPRAIDWSWPTRSVRRLRSLRGMHVGVGERLTGWVAAQPAADRELGRGARSRRPSGRRRTPPLESCMSVPLMVGETLVGVLTLYSRGDRRVRRRSRPSDSDDRAAPRKRDPGGVPSLIRDRSGSSSCRRHQAHDTAAPRRRPLAEQKIEPGTDPEPRTQNPDPEPRTREPQNPAPGPLERVPPGENGPTDRGTSRRCSTSKP